MSDAPRIVENPEYEAAPYEERFLWSDGIQPVWMGPPRRFRTEEDALKEENEVPPYIKEKKI